MSEEEKKPPVPKQPEQNGIRRPRPGNLTSRVWEIADELSAAAGEAVARAAVMAAGEAEGLNPATIATQYGRWRRFNGLGRATLVAAANEALEAEDAAEVEG